MKKLFPRKKERARLGQHLLTSAYIARDVANAATVSADDTVLEVGPGKGMLTKELLALGAQIVAVEKDTEMVLQLRNVFEKELESRQLVLIEEDVRSFLTTDHPLLATDYKVVANIPYYITGELLRSFLTAVQQPTAISLLVQKEVAERIARSEKESMLSLSVNVYGTSRYVKTVRAGSFNPPPKVDSAILSIIDVSRDNFKEVPEELFFDVIKQGFSHKRKTLLGNLKKKYKKDILENFWTAQNLNKNIRAEDVSLTTWLLLSKNLA